MTDMDTRGPKDRTEKSRQAVKHKVKRKGSQSSPPFQPTPALPPPPVHVKLVASNAAFAAGGGGNRSLPSSQSAPTMPADDRVGSGASVRMKPGGAVAARRRKFRSGSKGDLSVGGTRRSPRMVLEGGFIHHPTSPGWSPSFDLLSPSALSSSDSESEDEFVLLDMKVDELAPPDDPLGLRRRHVRSASMPLLFDPATRVGLVGHTGTSGANTVRNVNMPNMVRRSTSARRLPPSARFQKKSEKLSHSDWIRSSTNQGSPGLCRGGRKPRTSRVNTLPNPIVSTTAAAGAAPPLMTVRTRPKRFPQVPASPKSPKIGKSFTFGSQGNTHSAVQGSGGHPAAAYRNTGSPKTPANKPVSAPGGTSLRSYSAAYPSHGWQARTQTGARVRTARLPRCVTAPPGSIKAQFQRAGSSISPKAQPRSARSSLPTNVTTAQAAHAAASRHAAAQKKAAATAAGGGGGGVMPKKKLRAASDSGISVVPASDVLTKKGIERSPSSNNSDAESSVSSASSVSSSASSSDADM